MSTFAPHTWACERLTQSRHNHRELAQILKGAIKTALIFGIIHQEFVHPFTLRLIALIIAFALICVNLR